LPSRLSRCEADTSYRGETSRAHGPIPSAQWPAIVRVVDQIPVTTWFRPITGPLREAGIPKPRAGTQAWYLDASGDTYRSLTGAAHRRFVGQAA
jgi:putative long chain acyl-CoA synthase